jgi:hypothetical protein
VQEVALGDWNPSAGAFMYRVDKYGHVPAYAGFPFPPRNTTYFTGAGGLHFWVELTDAIAYTTENSLDHFFACPRVVEEAVVTWSRELMDNQMVHPVPTLVLYVDGYSAPYCMRNELVFPGSPPSIYKPVLVRINV